MINFMNDYNSPGHPDIIKAVADAAREKYPGYGTDAASERARNRIKALLGAGGDADVHFLAGGTQANVTAVSAFLRPHEAVIAADSAHINVHETGGIEAAGHKILLAGGGSDTAGAQVAVSGASGAGKPGVESGAQGSGSGASGAGKPGVGSGAPGTGSGRSGAGKLTAEGVRHICAVHADEHMVKPRLVYISQSTELGGVYTLRELNDLRAVCDEYGLLLYLDGARLAAALVSRVNDAQLGDIAALCDAFYIGGTKNGLLFGEALVIVNDLLKEDFRYLQKQRGGLLAKGFLLGLQFDALFENGLFFTVAGHADAMAERLRSGLEGLGCRFLVNSRTNQIFPIIRTEAVERLASLFLFETWSRVDEHYSSIRFVTSWNTTEDEVDALIEAYGSLER